MITYYSGMKFFNYLLLLFGVMTILAACDSEKKAEDKLPLEANKKPEIAIPEFNADSAYHFIEKQVSFGPRVPNGVGHRECGDYLVEKLKSYADEVKEQQFESKAYDGTNLYLKNIIASFNTNSKKRILLAAHWDTRPVADKDSVNKQEPIAGANDGGSGVGVLMEIARQLHLDTGFRVGVDLILFDGEDYGVPVYEEGFKNVPYSGYCLGSQYWARNKHVPGYSAYYGVLLDMVGAKGAKFYQEGLSMSSAPSIVKKVWDFGHGLGYGDYFIYQKSQDILDDHRFVNQWANIPMIDIVEYDPATKNYFSDYHHTHRDNMDLIDKNTLKAVGQTVLKTIYLE
ncbi:M28 family peptidase [Fulvivirgaceae bacterium BMA12]|uniref:M28 family peptidase n=1 Tax=Agaribacillus aureus TaxID=3051825 RepID=A0ABT8LD94_9BACT|nr:M28 family peptidase [Fulvivirgaceae bacterium BMA12]